MDNSIIDIMYNILTSFLLTPGFPFRFGLMIAAAITLGFSFSRIKHYDVKAWIAIMAIFLIFQEWLRSAINSPTDIEVVLKPWILAFTSAGIFTTSFWFGGWIARTAKESARKEYVKGQKGFSAKV